MKYLDYFFIASILFGAFLVGWVIGFLV